MTSPVVASGTSAPSSPASRSVDLGHRDPDRARAGHLVGVLQRHAGDHVALGDAVPLDPGEAPALDDLAVQVGRHGQVPGHLDVVVAVARVRRRLEQEQRDRGEAQDQRDPVVAHHVPEPRHAEAAHHHQRPAGGQALEQQVAGVGVEELQAAQHPVVGVCGTRRSRTSTVRSHHSWSTVQPLGMPVVPDV